jgi:hypothetical protein
VGHQRGRPRARAGEPDAGRQLGLDHLAGLRTGRHLQQRRAVTRQRQDPRRRRLQLFSPPSVVGSLRTGHFARPLPATWLGGWGDERPLLQLQVCKSRRDASCNVISSTFGWDKCPAGTGARIAPRYAGWYLRVAEAHEGKDIVFAERAYTRPDDIPAMQTSAITAVATVGRIQPGRRPNRRC